MNRGRRNFIMAKGNMPMAITTNRSSPIRTTVQTITMGQHFNIVATTGAVGLVQVQSINLLRGLTPGSMRLSLVASVTQTAQLCLTLRDTWRQKLNLHQSHKKLIDPSQATKHVPENLGGSAFHEATIRHSCSHVDTPNMSSETEIVHICRKSQNECAVITMIDARSQKALWDSGAGRCIISYGCYNSLHPKYRTELFQSSVKIKAANGMFIANKGECDIILKINNERFTFPFLCLDQLS